MVVADVGLGVNEPTGVSDFHLGLCSTRICSAIERASSTVVSDQSPCISVDFCCTLRHFMLRWNPEIRLMTSLPIPCLSIPTLRPDYLLLALRLLLKDLYRIHLHQHVPLRLSSRR